MPFIVLHPSQPTHYPHDSQRRPSVIDIVLTNTGISVNSIETLNHLNSDHNPVKCVLGGAPLVEPIPPRWDFTKANWAIFRQAIENSVNLTESMRNATEINDSVENFICNIRSAVRASIPTQCPSGNEVQISNETKSLIQERNSVKRRWQRTRNTDIKRLLNRINKEIGKKIIEDQNRRWASKLAAIKPGQRQLWSTVKKMRKRSSANIPVNIRVGNQTTSTPQEKAQALADVFEKAHKITENFQHTRHKFIARTVSEFKNRPNRTPSDPGTDVTTSEIDLAIKEVKKFKAPGPDGIQNIIVKNLPPSAIRYLSRMYTSCLKIGHFPSQWKIAKVVPIHKHGTDTPQGSTLSAALFNIYTSDMPIPHNCQIALYADDTAIKSTRAVVNRLQASLVKITEYSNNWKIKINLAKTQLILFPFNNSARRNASLDLKINNVNIHWRNEVKYLGLTLDRKLTFKPHVMNARVKALNAFKAVYTLLHHRSAMNVNNKMLIYKLVIQPILLYAAPVWLNAAQHVINSIQVVQNKVLKTIFGLPRRFPTTTLHEIANCKIIRNQLSSIEIKFNERCLCSPIDYINNLIT